MGYFGRDLKVGLEFQNALKRFLYDASLLMFYDGNTEEVEESDNGGAENGVRNKKKDIDFKIADFANCVTLEDSRFQDRPCPPMHPESPDNGFLRGLRSLRKYFLAIQAEIRSEMGISSETQDEANGVELTDEDDAAYISY